ncbi:hypothetical protein [Cupriavidus sp. TMH.W2]|uniref:hypothetical protein n=1 Tax=Cupriavidus sp. TMH.W2 TaxID=3434465 RepID=UPI003D77A026
MPSSATGSIRASSLPVPAYQFRMPLAVGEQVPLAHRMASAAADVAYADQGIQGKNGGCHAAGALSVPTQPSGKSYQAIAATLIKIQIRP